MQGQNIHHLQLKEGKFYSVSSFQGFLSVISWLQGRIILVEWHGRGKPLTLQKPGRKDKRRRTQTGNIFFRSLPCSLWPGPTSKHSNLWRILKLNHTNIDSEWINENMIHLHITSRNSLAHAYAEIKVMEVDIVCK